MTGSVHGFPLARLLLAAGFFLGAAPAVMAQVPLPSTEPVGGWRTYDVKNMTFDLWCQQTEHYPSDRCAEQRPDDVKAFQDYRAQVERYELQYLKQVEQDRDARARGNRDAGDAVRDLQDATPAN